MLIITKYKLWVWLQLLLKKNFIQRLLQHIKDLAFIIFYKNWSKNKKVKNIILRGHPKIDTYYTNLSLILLLIYIS